MITYGPYFTAKAATLGAEPQIAPVAAVFATDHLPAILFPVQRGIRRALALQRCLLARAAKGRNLRFVWPPYVDLQPRHRPPPKPPQAKPAAPRRTVLKEPALPGDDPTRAFYLPSGEELDAQMRRRPVGRTMPASAWTPASSQLFAKAISSSDTRT